MTISGAHTIVLRGIVARMFSVHVPPERRVSLDSLMKDL